MDDWLLSSCINDATRLTLYVQILLCVCSLTCLVIHSFEREA
jgi:hypothetical protein